MVSKALKIRQSEGIELLCEIAFFRNLLTDVPLRPRLLAKRPVLDRRWLNLRRSCLSRVVVAKVQNRSEFAIPSKRKRDADPIEHGGCQGAQKDLFTVRPAKDQFGGMCAPN
jgi:hypothetical protein